MSRQDETFLLFVYGTLMRGGCRHHFLDGQPYLGPARTQPEYALYHLGDYPGMVEQQADGLVVSGELYRVPASLLPDLDQTEGAPSLFRLQPVRLEGHSETVYAYLYQHAVTGFPLCPGQCWSNS